jgi:beta-xylosidase
VLRSKSILGPYEDKIVLERGSTVINGPHQGAWVETQKGESWFLHFQDYDAYGRITHLQPMRWENDWPLIGEDFDKNGVGEPVMQYRKPDIGKKVPVATPLTTDEFNNTTLGLQWQWEANNQQNWFSLSSRKGWLRLNVPSVQDSIRNFWFIGNIFAQKFPAPQFRATVKVEFKPVTNGEKTGLIVYGSDYAFLGIDKSAKGYKVMQSVCLNADKGMPEKEVAAKEIADGSGYLRVEVTLGALCSFSYSLDGISYLPIGEKFAAKAGRWVGAKVGLFAVGPKDTQKLGYAEYDWFRVTPIGQ